jgi:hypothetical protein
MLEYKVLKKSLQIVHLLRRDFRCRKTFCGAGCSREEEKLSMEHKKDHIFLNREIKLE